MTIRASRLACAAVIAGLGMVLVSGAARSDSVLTITTQYGFSIPLGTLTPFGGPSPDTGWVTFTNNGTTTFLGTLSDIAVAGAGSSNFSSGSISLAPGASYAWAINDESSNRGG